MAKDDMLALNRSLLRVGDRVCCAVSGGADSVAMLLALAELNARKESLGIVLQALHVHHGLRGEAAEADAVFVRALCERLGVPLTIVRVDTAARQAATGEGLEEAARELRYDAFREVLGSMAADVVATAHTLDDQAETVLMKLLRGAWTEGLGGIAPVLEGGRVAQGRVAQGRVEQGPASCDPDPPKPGVLNAGLSTPAGQAAGAGRIVRPLLGVRRSAVEAFLQSRGQAWREDETNRDLRFTRNRVRHELLPLLRSFNPGVEEALAQVAGTAREEEAFWQSEVARVLPGLLLPGLPVRGGGRAVGTQVGERTCSIEIARLKALPGALQRRVLRAAARDLGVRLTGDETARLMALASLAPHPSVTGRPGARLDLHAGLRAERSARELRLGSRFGPPEGRRGENAGQGTSVRGRMAADGGVGR